MTPEITVVIPAHNAAETLRAQLAAVLGQETEAPFDVVVVDNGSNDATAAIVESEPDPRVRLIVASDGSGPSYARNAGVAAAQAELIACCDADDVVSSHWLEQLRTALSRGDFAGGPLEVDRLNPSWLADGRGRWGARGPGQFAGIDFAHGCNLAIRKSVFDSLGGFDESLRAGEEVDLAVRLAGRGITLQYAPDAVVHYRYRPDLRSTWNQSFAHGYVASTLEARAGEMLGVAVASERAARAWWLLTRCYKLATRAGRIRWTWIAANLCGRLSRAIAVRRGRAPAS
jgi:GT2 family glycosyltransferase